MEAKLIPVEQALEAALQEVFARLMERVEDVLQEDGAEVERGGVFGDRFCDAELVADKKLGLHLVMEITEQADLRKLVHTVTVEGRPEPFLLNEQGVLEAYVDPLDNSQGFYALMGMHPRDRAGSAHRFASVITLVDRMEEGVPLFEQVVAVGVQPLHHPKLDPIIATRDSMWPPERRLKQHPSPFLSKRHGKMGLNRTILFEAYYPETRRVIERGFFDVSGALRSWGCAALEMAAVATGEVEAFISCSQKHHEAGLFRAVLAAGGVAYSWTVPTPTIGQVFHGGSHLCPIPLVQTPYAFDAASPILLASSEALASELFERLARGYSLSLSR